MVWRRTPFASAAGWTVAIALSTISRQLHGLHVQPDLAGDDPRDVEDVLDNLGQPRRVAFERLETAGRLLAGENAAAQQPRVADDRIQRRAQLVREHGEEFVLDPIGFLRVHEQPRILAARPTPTPAMPSTRRSCCSVNTPACEWPKNRPPSTSPPAPVTGTAR